MSAITLITSVLLGLALAATCGIRVFLPLLGASVAAAFHLIPLQDGFAWLGSITALVCLVLAAVVEIVAYYIPRFDPILDTLTWPLAIVTGGLLSASMLPAQYPVVRWALGLVGGGAAAGIVHASTVLLKLFSSRATPGSHRVATAKNAVALGGILLSIFLPAAAGMAAIILLGWLWIRLWKRFQPLRSR